MAVAVSHSSNLAYLLRGLVGVTAGIVTVAMAHRASQIISRWALANDLVELHGNWILPRFAAWAVVSLAIGSLLGLTFGRRVIVPAVIAAITPPLVYVCSFLYLFGPDGLTLVRPYWFESLVVLVLLPASAIAVSKIHGA